MKKQTFCAQHSCPHSFLILKAGSTKLACGECIYQMQDDNQKVDFGQIISIQKVKSTNIQAYSSAEQFISKLTGDEKYSTFLNQVSNLSGEELKSQYIDLELSMNNLKQSIDLVLQQTKSFIETIIDMRKKVKQDLQQIVKYDEFLQLLQDLGNQGDDAKSDAYQQIENKLQHYIEELQNKNGNGLNGEIDQMFNNYKNGFLQCYNNFNQLEQLDKQFKETYGFYQSFIENVKNNYSIGFLDVPKSLIISQDYFKMLITTINSKTKQKSYNKANLIYLGTKDGLNNNSFWNKVNGKSNLLMVFKSKLNHVFGGYSPCKWTQNLNGYVQDDTLSSFIFSEKNQAIYSIRENKKSLAIYCAAGQGPTFGCGFDIQVGANFQSGYCKLGQSYLIQEANFNTNTIFGSPQPNVVECEIYEIL